MQLLNKIFADGPSLGGGLGFLLYYELLTSQYSVRIQPSDEPHQLGALLTRHLNASQINEKSLMFLFALLCHCLCNRFVVVLSRYVGFIVAFVVKRCEIGDKWQNANLGRHVGRYVVDTLLIFLYCCFGVLMLKMFVYQL